MLPTTQPLLKPLPLLLLLLAWARPHSSAHSVLSEPAWVVRVLLAAALVSRGTTSSAPQDEYELDVAAPESHAQGELLPIRVSLRSRRSQVHDDEDDDEHDCQSEVLAVAGTLCCSLAAFRNTPSTKLDSANEEWVPATTPLPTLPAGSTPSFSTQESCGFVDTVHHQVLLQLQLELVRNKRAPST